MAAKRWYDELVVVEDQRKRKLWCVLKREENGGWRLLK